MLKQYPKIIVRPESSNLWWGVYGFCEKIGWEDLNLFYDNEERISSICLNTKGYLRSGIEDLNKDPDEKEFVSAVESYLSDDKCHYWYYYDDIEDEDFQEVSYDAPKNRKGVKPRFMDIWHPDEAISISTIKSGIEEFARKFLRLDNCEIEIQNIEPFEESFKTFIKNKELFSGDSPVTISFSNEIVEELSLLWNISKDEVLKKLNKSIK